MTISRMSCFSLVIMLVTASVSGCQSVGGQHSAAFRNGQDVIQTVKAEQAYEERAAVVTLSQELEAAPEEVSSGSTKQSLWSKIQTPTRFLLPRTENSATPVLDAEQGLDDGF